MGGNDREIRLVRDLVIGDFVFFLADLLGALGGLGG
jgi:hypothetical protein